MENSSSAQQRQNEVRQGTSDTRQVQQSGTHAEGLQSHATPAVVDHGHGDKTRMVEPGTIGQAPKDISVPEQCAVPQRSEENKGYVEQAKNTAGDAVASVRAMTADVANKVGLGTDRRDESKEQSEKQVSEEKGRQDSQVDKMGDAKVEDFIRSKYASRHTPSAKSNLE